MNQNWLLNVHILNTVEVISQDEAVYFMIF